MSTPRRTALVTGANKGIGLEIARRLAAEKMTVYLGARDPERGAAAVATLTVGGADVRFTHLDVTDQALVDQTVATIAQGSGRLDVLVNNAGVVMEWGGQVATLDADTVRDTYEVNVFGVVRVTQACIPLLRCAPAARVVNLSSPLGSLAFLTDPENPISRRGLLAYSSSKAALNAITVLYANALRSDGILVNAANPGLVASDLNEASPFPRGTRTPAQGASAAVALALLGADGPTGTFRGDDNGSIELSLPW